MASAGRKARRVLHADAGAQAAGKVAARHLLGILSQGYQRRPQLNLIWIVEVQHAYRGASLRCDAFDCCPGQPKMVFPAIPSRMEQGRNGARLWIKRGAVAAFMAVAFPTTQA